MSSLHFGPEFRVYGPSAHLELLATKTSKSPNPRKREIQNPNPMPKPLRVLQQDIGNTSLGALEWIKSSPQGLTGNLGSKEIVFAIRVVLLTGEGITNYTALN